MSARHQADIGQAGLIHAVGDIGHAQAVEQLQNLAIFLGAVDFRFEKSAAAPAATRCPDRLG